MLRLRLSLLLALLALLWPPAVHADGVIIEPPPHCPDAGLCPRDPHPLFPLTVQNHHVTVTIQDQVATTHVDETFRNDTGDTVEGTYIFPIPAEAAVTDFAMWVDGQRVAGKVLTADEARQVYDDIVRQMRDPALLEYAGRGAVQASIFPVAPGDTRHVELSYAQVLVADNGLIHYSYPLNTEKFSARPLEQVSISVQVVSAQPVHAIYSPSHSIAVTRDGDYRFTASYEAGNVTPDADFDLYYSMAADDIGLNLVSYRDPATGQGFFMLLAAPSVAVTADQVVAKDVLVVLDQSGSMAGEKFAQAQGALDYVLGHLNAEDRFNVIAFSTGTRRYAQELQPATQAADAGRWVHTLEAAGSTDINLALSEALAEVAPGSTRPVILIFVTDGLATEGVTDSGRILDNIAQAAPKNVRLFAFGVGDDVDTFLLDSLAEQNHGASSYVRPDERIDEAVSGFYARVSTPVLANITLDFGGATVEAMYPDPLPDLFAGSQLVVTGQYRDPGPATIKLSGTVNGEARTYTYSDLSFSAGAGGNDFIPRLWATRSIGHLLNEIRLHGEKQELIDSIVALSVRYGIVTPYTSYLVTDGGSDVLTEAGRSALAASQFATAAGTQDATSGADAVVRAEAQSALAGAAAPAAVQGQAADTVRIVGSRTFLFRDGVWIDTGFDASHMQAVPVAFASDAYFALLAARPELAGPFGLGSQVIALAADGTAYQVRDASTPPATPPAATPEPGVTSTPPVATSGPIATATQGTANTNPPPGSSRGLCAAALLAPAVVMMTLVGRRRGRRPAAAPQPAPRDGEPSR